MKSLFLLSGTKHRNCHRAFTVTELLVVISLIVVLAAMLLPALSRAQGSTRVVMCKSNLHQIGIVLRSYLDDSDGVYPYSESIPHPNERGFAFWFDALLTSDPTGVWGERIFKCPGYEGLHYEGELRGSSSGALSSLYLPCGSYAYNASGRRLILAAPSGPVRAGLGFAFGKGEPIQRPHREQELRAPSELYVFGDALAVTGPWGPTRKPQLGGALDYNSLVSDNPLLEQVQHRVLFNMLFADSHAESVGTNPLLSTLPAHRSRWNYDHLP